MNGALPSNNNNRKWIIQILVGVVVAGLSLVAKINYDGIGELRAQIIRVEEEQKRRGQLVGRIEVLTRQVEDLQKEITRRAEYVGKVDAMERRLQLHEDILRRR